MITKVLFLFTMRAGSHMVGRLLSACPDFNLEASLDHPGTNGSEGPDNLIYVATDPKYICPMYTSGTCRPMGSTLVNTNTTFKYQAFLSYVADGPSRWGIDVNPKVNLPEYGMAWSAPEVAGYTLHLKQRGIDFKIVHSIRDGRNQLASLKKLEQPAHCGWSKHRWQQICNLFKFRAENALEASALCENYKIVKFEDLVLNPVDTLQDIVNFTGIPLDIDGRISDCLKIITPNSSFQREAETRTAFLEKFRKTDITERWKILTREERIYMYQTAGNELRKLGYINNNKWIEE